MDIMKNVAVPQRMDSQFMKPASTAILPVITIQSSLRGILSKDLPHPVFRVLRRTVLPGREEKLVRMPDALLAHGHPATLFEPTFDLIHEPSRHMAHPSSFGLGVLGGKKNSRAAEIHVSEPYPRKLSHPASQFVNEFHHELVPVIFNGIQESPPLVQSQVPYSLPETLIIS